MWEPSKLRSRDISYRFSILSFKYDIIYRNGVPLTNSSKSADNDDQVFIQNAQWSPAGSELVFVYKNDLYFKYHGNRHSRVDRITDTGSSTVFNGIPDWLYQGKREINTILCKRTRRIYIYRNISILNIIKQQISIHKSVYLIWKT